jgi:tellurite resistance protein
MPSICKAADVVTALSAVVRATADGEISPEEAASLATVISAQRAAIELVELEARVSALEGAESYEQP